MHRLGTASFGSMIRGIRSGHVARKSMTGSLNLIALGSLTSGSTTSGSTMGSTWTGTTTTGSQAAIARSLTTRAGTLGSHSPRSQSPRSHSPGSSKRSVSTGSRIPPKNPYISSPRALRAFSSTSALSHNHIHKPKDGEELHVTFISKDGSQQTFEVAEGDNILDIAQSYNLDMEGACGGSCACSTCHVIVDPEFYDEIPEPDDDENDMLDLAFGLTETSRLGCQIKMSKALDGIRIALPAMTRNLQSRDFN